MSLPPPSIGAEGTTHPPTDAAAGSTSTSTSNDGTPPFARLSKVTLQLVMQHCDQRSLLRLARCNRTTLAAASDPFAWRCLGRVRLNLALRMRVDAPTPTAEAQGSLPPPPPLPADPSRSPLSHVDQWAVWNEGRIVPSGSYTDFDPAFEALESLPRLVAVDAPSLYFRLHRAVAARRGRLSGLTALDVVAVLTREEDMRALAHHLPQLRMLQCAPVGAARACLQPLVSLARLADLRLEVEDLEGTHDDFAVVADCANLRRLVLRDANEACCAAMLLAPAMQRLQDLTLARLKCKAQPQLQTDWAAVCTNLHSLRRLTLDRCDSASVAAILAALTAGQHPLQLRRLRIGLPVIARTNSWTVALRALPTAPGQAPLADCLDALIGCGRPLGVELRVGFGRAGVSASWLLSAPPHDWRTALPHWTNFKVLCPPRDRYRQHSLLFDDDELDCQTTLDGESW